MLLNRNQHERITIPGAMKHPFFEGYNWKALLKKEVEPPLDQLYLEGITKSLTGEESFLVI